MATQGFLFHLELRVQFCLLVCCTYPSLSTVNKEKNRTDQRASLRLDTRETQHSTHCQPQAWFAVHILHCRLLIKKRTEQISVLLYDWTREKHNTPHTVKIKPGKPKETTRKRSCPGTLPHAPLQITASLAWWLRRPPRERKVPGSNPAGAGIFFGVESYQ